MYAKTGLDVIMPEASVMRYIAQHTTIPIPSVIDAIPVPMGAFIVMTRMAGEPIRGRLSTMSPEERLLLASDLKGSFNQLRSITEPTRGPRICGFGGGPLKCSRISFDFFGPFATEPEFYRFLYERVYAQQRDYLENFGREVHSTPHKICLSHNDLNPLNILVDKNGRLTAIIDWECAAWLPDYWEYTRSYFHRELYDEWLYLMDECFGPWPEELKVEQEMWKFNDPY